MLDVAIVGAGDLGGAIAHRLACHDIASAVRLIDDAGGVAAGKTLDIMQAAALQRFSTRVSGSADLMTAAGSDVIVIADAWRPDESVPDLALVRRIVRFAQRAALICAQPSHLDLIDAAIGEGVSPRDRIFGTAPEALALGLKALIAVEAGVSVRDVSLTVLGAPPRFVVPWNETAVGGLAIARVLSDTAVRRLAAQVQPLWPPGPQALAGAVTIAIEAMSGRTRHLVSCFVGPDDSMGSRHRTVAMPVRLGPSGVVAVHTPALDVHDQVMLDNARLR
jgi:malate dehydrogenase